MLGSLDTEVLWLGSTVKSVGLVISGVLIVVVGGVISVMTRIAGGSGGVVSVRLDTAPRSSCRSICGVSLDIVIKVGILGYMSIKRPSEPMFCPECGGPEIASGLIREHFHQTPGPTVPALHTRRQLWACGHESKQWWFDRWDYDGVEILAAGDGPPPYTCYSDYKRSELT